MLHEVVERARQHRRPLLVAIAQRDLAQVLARQGELTAAHQEAQSARTTFEQLGAKGEIAKIEASD
ncbi:MAG: hypothetical protein HY560_12280 [Gemmatimonadetes bacterium]|nr:hypothetical protein [Gemmatimonadota bacterium]